METVEFTRKCPLCTKDLFYTTKLGLHKAINANSLCSSCCQLSSEKRGIEAVPGEKFCNKCETTKSLLDFYNNSRTYDGKQAYCKECQNHSKLEWSRLHSGKVEEITRRFRDKDRVAYNAYHRNWKRQRRADGKLPIDKRYRIRKVCDLTIEQEDRILNWSGGNCPVCGVYMKERGAGGDKANIDHDHITNKFRDLICGSCNWMLGAAKDNETTLLNAVEYLRRHNAEFSRKIAA